MTTQALRSRSVGELVDATFTLYRKDAAAYVSVGALAGTPGLIVQLFWSNEAGYESLTAALFASLITVVTYSLMTGVIIRVGSDVYLGGSADIQRALRAVWPKVGTLIAVSIMKAILLFLGALLLLVGFFYAGSRWFAPEAVCILENTDSSKAFARCTNLSEGRKWHIFRTLLLGYGIYILLMIGIAAIAAMFGGYVVTTLTQTVFTVVAYPTIALLTMLLYYDARIRGEGFDVEHLASSLGSAGTR
ncbi:MAG: hypothetical protein KIT38_02100 [Gemmatimonadaceae bacterium]|nr:hypothetical protein [Gemmatimonadaceae bacterium]